MQQVTKEQIKQLYQFTAKHRVRYYDLQTEVVDHLASAIEAKWLEKPDLPFETALNQVYDSFGIYGFGKLEQEKREALQKKIARRIWIYVKSYLTPPKILLTLLLVVLTYYALPLVENPSLIREGFVYLTMLLFSGIILVKRANKKDLVNKYLEINVLYTAGFPVLFLPVYLIDVLGIAHNDQPLFLGILAFWIVISFFTALGFFQYIIEATEEIKLRYAEH